MFRRGLQQHNKLQGKPGI